jgi:hypothetical protein
MAGQVFNVHLFVAKQALCHIPLNHRIVIWQGSQEILHFSILNQVSASGHMVSGGEHRKR